MADSEDYIAKAARQSEHRPAPNLMNSILFANNNKDSDKDKHRDNRSSSSSDCSERSERPDKIVEKFEELKTAETDMLFHLMANDDKLVDTSEREFYKKESESESESSHKVKDYTRTDDLDDLLRGNSHNGDDKYKYTNTYTNGYSTSKPDYTTNTSYGSSPNVKSSWGSSGTKFPSKEEENLAKLDILRKLGDLTRYHNVKLSQNYNMQSDYDAMKYEYELHASIREKHNGVKWMSNMMLNIFWGIELTNDKFNPFDFHLKGWTEQQSDDIGEYYDVIGELYEKYFKAGQPIPPELKLMFMISASAVQFHITHSMLGNMPGLNDSANLNPSLVEKLRDLKNVSARQNVTQNDTEHEAARQRAADLQMLKEQEQEYMRMQQQQQMQQQMQQNSNQQYEQMRSQMEKQQRLAQLQNQLNMQRSDTQSMYTGMQQTDTEQMTMAMPKIPVSLQNMQYSFDPQQQQEAIRQQQIMNQKRTMQQQEILRNLQANQKSTARINPNIDEIIGSRIDDDDMSTIGSFSDDNSSVLKRRRKRKRKGIRIDA